jgi:V/A-type H+/Na+-transporting ATPase subunit E
MESKLQELTSRIYNEGIEKANKEAAIILENAQKEADMIVENAKKEAQRLQETARHETEEMRKNVASEVQMSARQSISAIKQQITSMVTTRLVAEPVREAFKDKDFVKSIIETVIKNWDPKSGGIDLALTLPKEDAAKLGSYFETKTRETLNGKLKVDFDDKMSGGFRIGPGDKSYVLSFTEEDFENFFKNYLRPRTTKLLYGGE